MIARNGVFLIVIALLSQGLSTACRSSSPDEAAPPKAAEQAATQPASDSEGAPDRVAQLSFVDGAISMLPVGADDWEKAGANEPVLEGYELYADDGASGELVLGDGRYARFGDGAAVAVTRLDPDWAQLGVRSGTVTLTTTDVGPQEHFEIDAPGGAVVPTAGGSYRVDVDENGDAWLTVERGTVEVTTPNGTFTAQAGDVVNLSHDNSTAASVVTTGGSRQSDDWDNWNAERDRYYDDLHGRSAPEPVRALFGRNDIFGLAALVAFGVWRATSHDRYVWQPDAARRADWSPYEDGRWAYEPAVGWTWIPEEPWGWAPYHYGRWDHSDEYGWAWVPEDGVAERAVAARYRWRPALVYVWQPRQGTYAWVPLAPGEPYVAYTVPAYESLPQQVTVAFQPRYVVERRGILFVTGDGLERRVRPRLARREEVESWGVHDASALAHAGIPKPGRIVSAEKRARVRPRDAVLARSVVVDSRSLEGRQARAAKDLRRAERPVRTAERKAVAVERRQAVAEAVAPPRLERRGGKMHGERKAARAAAAQHETDQPRAAAPVAEPAASRREARRERKAAGAAAGDEGPGKGRGRANGPKGKKGKPR
jgi:hypothetical protein